MHHTEISWETLILVCGYPSPLTGFSHSSLEDTSSGSYKPVMSDARVTFDFRRGTILVEGPADDLTKLFDAVRAAAPTLKQINIVTNDTVGSVDVPMHEPVEPRTSSQRPPSMRDFARRFPFENIPQRIAVLAYYSAKYDQRPSFSVKEMSDWFGLCGFKKPTQMPVAMSDAKRKYGYVESKGRDQWTISTGGENLVLEMTEANNGATA
jgi:hypothetical protein